MSKAKGSSASRSFFVVIMAAAFIVSGFFALNAQAVVNSIDIDSPNGNEFLRGIFDIQWTAVGDPGELVDIYYSTNNFTTSTKLTASGVLFDVGTFSWDTVAAGISDGSTYKVKVQSITNPGVQGSSADDFTIDNTPPFTEAVINPIGPDGDKEWYVTQPEITLSCDDGAGSGCNETFYAFDGGVFALYAGPFLVPEGEHTLTFYSTDKAVDNVGDNNEETPKTFAIDPIKVDLTDPDIDSFTFDGMAADAFFNPKTPDSIDITVNATELVKFNRIYICGDADGICNDGTAVRRFTQTFFDTTTTKPWNGKNTGDVAFVDDGPYKVKVSLQDEAGRINGVTIDPERITVDTQGPEINDFNNPIAHAVYKTGSVIPITFTPTDPAPGTPLECGYVINGGDLIIIDSCVSGVSFSDFIDESSLTDGRNDVSAYVVDSAGNNFISVPKSIVFDDDDTLTVGPAGPPAFDFDKIQKAIEKATSGDTIWVASGTYTEPIGDCDGNAAMFCIDESLTITGDPGDPGVGPGSDAPKIYGDGEEASAFVISSGVSDVIIEGFEIYDFANDSCDCTGGVGSAILSWNTGATDITIQDNYLYDLGWNGVLTGSDDGSIQSGWTVQRNVIENADYAGIEFTNVINSTVGNNEITVSNGNWDEGDSGVGIEIAVRAHAGQNITAGTGIIVSDNVISDAGPDARAGINLLARAYTGTSVATLSGVTVQNNEVVDNATRGIFVVAEERNGGSAEVSNLTIEGNTIIGNDIGIEVGLQSSSPYANGTYDVIAVSNNINDNGFGLDNTTGVELNAENNYWGSANGPEHSSNTFNVGGQGDAVSDNVDFVPWLDAAPPVGVSFAPVTTTDPAGGQFSSIQAAVDGSNAGATISVAAGTFSEDVNVKKSVTLVGAGAFDTTTIQGQGVGEPGALVISADDVTVEGFNVIGSGVSAIRISGARDNITIQNNRAVAATNRNAFLTDGGQSNHTIEGNTFEGDASQLVYVNGVPSVGLVSINVDFIGNTFGGTATGPLLGQEADNSSITGNIFNGSTDYAALEIHGDNATVSDNTLTSSGIGAGILISGFSSGVLIDASSGMNIISGFATGIEIDGVDVIVQFNAIEGNGFGLNNISGEIVDAEKNWWGSFRGPFHDDTNLLGEGDEVSDNVDFSPWCRTSDLEECEEGEAVDVLGSIGPLDELLLEFDPNPVTIPNASELTVKAVDEVGALLVNDSREIELNAGGNTKFDDVAGPALRNLSDGVVEVDVTNSVPETVNVITKVSGAPFGEGTITFTGDETAPEIVSHTPADGTANVSVNAIPYLIFSEPLKAATVISANIQLKRFGDNSSVPAVVSLVEGGTRVKITPDDSLDFETQYYFAVSTAVQDEAGNPLLAALDAGTKDDHEFTTVELGGIILDDIILPSLGTANDTYLSGWHYIFRITVNDETETDLFVKFTDWVNTVDEEEVVPVFDNTRLLLNAGAGVGLTEEDIEGGFSLGNEYEDQTLNDEPTPVDISGVDNNIAKAGRQVQFDVFVKLPEDTAPGFYTTEFGILTETP